jgi:hypothetical protein
MLEEFNCLTGETISRNNLKLHVSGRGFSHESNNFSIMIFPFALHILSLWLVCTKPRMNGKKIDNCARERESERARGCAHTYVCTYVCDIRVYRFIAGFISFSRISTPSRTKPGVCLVVVEMRIGG